MVEWRNFDDCNILLEEKTTFQGQKITYSQWCDILAIPIFFS